MSSSVDTQGRDLKLKKLRSAVRRGKWPEVFGMCQQDLQLFKEDISGTRGTVLHMAVSNRKEKVVANIVDFLVHQGRMDILETKNNRGNTPLHLAAIIGNVEMCEKISRAKPSLIAEGNIDGETPLFLAVLYGRKKAFLSLHYLYRDSSQVSSSRHVPCKRKDDDTILHCAIEQGHIGIVGVKKKKQATTKEELERDRQPCVKVIYDTLKGYVTVLGRWLQQIWSPQIISRRATDPEHIISVQTEEEDENEENIPVVLKYLWALFLILPYLLWMAGIWLHRIQKMKEKHPWSLQIMNELLQLASEEDMLQIISRTPSQQLSLQTKENKGSMSMATPVFGTITIETPLMIAAKNGVEEMVKEILKLFPSRIEDVNEDGKNIVLLVIEHRQSTVFRFLCQQKWPTESLFRQVDKDRNNALHLAARLGVEPDWLNHGEALSMSKEINWFEYVKDSIPRGLLEKYNREMKTPEDIFKESHTELMKTEGEWVAKTSQACSVVSTLVMSVAFAACDTVPGGYDSKGYAILRNKPPAFKYFSSFSIAALSFSLVSTICFLSTVVASPSQSVHSWKHVPIKLYFGMCSMFASIVSLWISFCGGYFFTLDDDSQKSSHTLELYIVMSLLIIIFVVCQIPTFIGPTLSSSSPVPTWRLKATRPIEYRN